MIHVRLLLEFQRNKLELERAIPINMISMTIQFVKSPIISKDLHKQQQYQKVWRLTSLKTETAEY